MASAKENRSSEVSSDSGGFVVMFGRIYYTGSYDECVAAAGVGSHSMDATEM